MLSKVGQHLFHSCYFLKRFWLMCWQLSTWLLCQRFSNTFPDIKLCLKIVLCILARVVWFICIDSSSDIVEWQVCFDFTAMLFQSMLLEVLWCVHLMQFYDPLLASVIYKWQVGVVITYPNSIVSFHPVQDSLMRQIESAYFPWLSWIESLDLLSNICFIIDLNTLFLGRFFRNGWAWRTCEMGLSFSLICLRLYQSLEEVTL